MQQVNQVNIVKETEFKPDLSYEHSHTPWHRHTFTYVIRQVVVTELKYAAIGKYVIYKDDKIIKMLPRSTFNRLRKQTDCVDAIRRWEMRVKGTAPMPIIYVTPKLLESYQKVNPETGEHMLLQEESEIWEEFREELEAASWDDACRDLQEGNLKYFVGWGYEDNHFLYNIQTKRPIPRQ